MYVNINRVVNNNNELVHLYLSLRETDELCKSLMFHNEDDGDEDKARSLLHVARKSDLTIASLARTISTQIHVSPVQQHIFSRIIVYDRLFREIREA